MKIAVGKYYWSRDRRAIGKVDAELHHKTHSTLIYKGYSFTVNVHLFGDRVIISVPYTKRGEYFSSADVRFSAESAKCALDLVEEIPEEEAEAIIALEGGNGFDVS